MVHYQCFDILNKHHKGMECKDLSVQDQIEQVVSLEIRKYNKFNSIVIIFDNHCLIVCCQLIQEKYRKSNMVLSTYMEQENKQRMDHQCILSCNYTKVHD